VVIVPIKALRHKQSQLEPPDVDIEILVPSGLSRFIQVLGILDPNHEYCGSPLPFGFINTSISSGSSFVFVLGMVRMDLFKSESITINNSYDGLTDDLKQQRFFYCNDPTDSVSSSPSPSPTASVVPPTVTGVIPTEGGTTWPKSITITGSGFQPSPALTPVVQIGDDLCTSVAILSATQLTCTHPSSSTAGKVNIQVTNQDGGVGILTNGFTYLPGANPRFWLKADEGVSSDQSGVTTWADVSSGTEFSVNTKPVSGFSNPMSRPSGGPNSKAAIEFGGISSGAGSHMQSTQINFTSGRTLMTVRLTIIACPHQQLCLELI
jgi:hypothetical protein